MRWFRVDFRNIKTAKRLVLLASEKQAAVYKRYFSIFYIRVSKIYKGSEIWMHAVKKLDKLIQNEKK